MKKKSTNKILFINKYTLKRYNFTPIFPSKEEYSCAAENSTKHVTWPAIFNEISFKIYIKEVIIVS